MKVLIIEDELPAARQLTQMLKKLDPEIRVVEVLDSIEASVTWLQVYPAPDALFMDIQIADGISFEIFNQVKIISPVVFTTAFDQYAIKAFKVNALDYLLKPVEEAELAIVLEKIRDRNKAYIPEAQVIQALWQNMSKKESLTRILVKSGTHFLPVLTADIAYFYSEDGLTEFVTNAGKRYFAEFTLDQLTSLLPASDFFRIHRKMIIAVNSIQKISTHFNSRLKLQLAPEFKEDVFVARERVGEFKLWLGGKGE
jgi:two-component system LytT family response regulator